MRKVLFRVLLAFLLESFSAKRLSNLMERKSVKVRRFVWENGSNSRFKGTKCVCLGKTNIFVWHQSLSPSQAMHVNTGSLNGQVKVFGSGSDFQESASVSKYTGNQRLLLDTLRWPIYECAWHLCTACKLYGLYHCSSCMHNMLSPSSSHSPYLFLVLVWQTCSFNERPPEKGMTHTERERDTQKGWLRKENCTRESREHEGNTTKISFRVRILSFLDHHDSKRGLKTCFECICKWFASHDYLLCISLNNFSSKIHSRERMVRKGRGIIGDPCHSPSLVIIRVTWRLLYLTSKRHTLFSFKNPLLKRHTHEFHAREQLTVVHVGSVSCSSFFLCRQQDLCL